MTLEAKLLGHRAVAVAKVQIRRFVIEGLRQQRAQPQQPDFVEDETLILILHRVYLRKDGGKRQPMVVAFGVVVMTAAAFWSASIYASDLGRSAAESIARGGYGRPEVTISSTHDLNIAGLQNSDNPGSSKEFKYVGYSLLAYANKRWFLIRTVWRPNTPTVILPDDGSLRVDLLPVP
jgi:hypothetical protein